MHLQTADVRMPIWKARNWDMWFVSLTGLAATGFVGWWLATKGWKTLPGLLRRSIDVSRNFIQGVINKRL
jgi:hypothetical protein